MMLDVNAFAALFNAHAHLFYVLTQAVLVGGVLLVGWFMFIADEKLPEKPARGKDANANIYG